MGDESYLENKEEVLDLENMKVTELKKRLKSFGLSVAGNKSELVERLQNAMNSEKGIETMPEVDSTLINDSSDPLLTLVANESESRLVEDFSLSPSEKDDESKEQPSKPVDCTTNSNPASIPLKKRALAQAAAETVKVERKIVLKRNNIPTPQIVPVKPTVPLKIKNTITMNKTESTDADKHLEDDKSQSSLDGKSFVRLTRTPAKSELEKFVSRAERFKTVSSKDQSKSEIFAPSLETAVTSVSPVSSSVKLSNIEALKRRGERFGQNVSNVMKKMEDQERIQKRKCKFGTIVAGVDGISTPEEQEKKKKRAERFGM